MTDMRFSIDAMHRYVAYCSVGASTVRGLRTSGVVAAARDALRRVELGPYGSGTPKAFRSRLDRDTGLVQGSLPDGAQFWGVARKLLNIFLRGALYNTYLNPHYGLSALEDRYEMPLDSLSASGICDLSATRSLPRWTAVKHVTSEINEQYQLRAESIAVAHGTARVHLDAIFWGGR